jgi:DNA-binding transcriptional MerR regulator
VADVTPTWTVGRLAADTGLTVRTLHHYDELGLLVPHERTQAGHRIYGAADVERLYRIVALRRLGLSLEDVAGVLDGGDGALEHVVRRQLATVDERIELEQQLRGLLTGVLEALERAERPGVDTVLKAIEVTKMIEKYYTPDQLQALAERREQLGEEKIREVEREWGEIFATLRSEMKAGTDPTDPKFAPLRTRMSELIAMFHGGDAGIKQSMYSMWANEDVEDVSHGMVDRELAAYMHAIQRPGG